MRLDEAAYVVRVLADDLEAGALEAARDVAGRAYERARELSRGGYASRDLRRLDHPYARRHGSPKLDPAVVNYGRGVFFGGWRVRTPQRYANDTIQGAVLNEAPQAPYLEGGTETMFPRPLMDRVVGELEAGDPFAHLR